MMILKQNTLQVLTSFQVDLFPEIVIFLKEFFLGSHHFLHRFPVFPLLYSLSCPGKIQHIQSHHKAVHQHLPGNRNAVMIPFRFHMVDIGRIKKVGMEIEVKAAGDEIVDLFHMLNRKKGVPVYMGGAGGIRELNLHRDHSLRDFLLHWPIGILAQGENKPSGKLMAAELNGQTPLTVEQIPEEVSMFLFPQGKNNCRIRFAGRLHSHVH